MSRPLRTAIGAGLSALTVVVFFVLLAFSLVRLSAIERTVRLQAPHNMLWVISQAEVASLRLTDVVGQRALGERDPQGLQRRYNVFLSRLDLLQRGPQHRQMAIMGYADRLDRLRGTLPEIKARVVALQAGDVAGAEGLRALLEPYNELFGEAATSAMVMEWDSIGGKLDAARKQVWQIAAFLLGILLAGAALVVHLLLATREGRQRARLLSQEKAFSERVIGSSGEGIMAVDLEQRCTVWNHAAEQLFRRPAKAVIGRSLTDVAGFFATARVATAVSASLEGWPATLFDQLFFPAPGSSARYLDLRCFPLRSQEQVIGSIMLVFDVTERRAAQREIAMHRDHLEELVQSRTRELNAALDRERAAAELYQNFGAMISHQFRTPLAVVDSALQRLIRRADRLSAEEVRTRGGKARGALGRLVKLIESTLDAARLDAGQVAVRSEPCELGQLVFEVCARQQESTDRTIRVAGKDGQALWVQCDPAHVEHIVTNLLANAVKYSPVGTAVTVTVGVEGEQVACAVSNQGRLQLSGERDVLFERYYRGDNARGHAGIGIGLYMARALARMQGGDVVLASTGPEQVTLVLKLPRTGQLHEPLRSQWTETT